MGSTLVYSGEITPNEGLNVLNLIKAKAELVEIVDLKNGMEALKTTVDEMQQNNTPYRPPIIVEAINECN